MMAKKICNWKTVSGRNGFVQEESASIFSKKWVVYEKGKRFLGLGSEKIGELRPDLKLDELLKELEKIIGEEVIIWKV